jgi:peptidoglycan hydrolase-like protein with peptidoglycan-binding domain
MKSYSSALLIFVFCFLAPAQYSFAETIVIETVSGTTTSTSTVTVPSARSIGDTLENKISALLEALNGSINVVTQQAADAPPSHEDTWPQDIIFGTVVGSGTSVPSYANEVPGSTGATCTQSFNVDRSIGDFGPEVFAIQTFLNSMPETQLSAEGPGSPGQETEYFGTATLAAVIRFQALYTTEILVKSNLAAPTGYWGSASRAMANTLQGCK